MSDNDAYILADEYSDYLDQCLILTEEDYLDIFEDAADESQLVVDCSVYAGPAYIELTEEQSLASRVLLYAGVLVLAATYFAAGWFARGF